MCIRRRSTCGVPRAALNPERGTVNAERGTQNVERRTWNVPPRQAGLTLIELVMFIVIVGVGIAGILLVMNFTTSHSADPMVRKQALAGAESLLEEIELKDFANPTDGFTGAATQANRPLFDDVSDYNGFATTGIFTLDGAPVGGLGSYSVAVGVAASAGAELGIAAADAKRITVTATDPTGQAITVTGYRTNY